MGECGPRWERHEPDWRNEFTAKAQRGVKLYVYDLVDQSRLL